MVGQLEVWIATQRGEITEAMEELNKAHADATVALVMLCRRRASVARVLYEFYQELGEQFGQYCGDSFCDAPLRLDDELETVRAYASALSGEFAQIPQLLIELALIAAIEGNSEEGYASLKTLLASYPGCVSAAIAGARFALGCGDVGQALIWLATIEVEARTTQEGGAAIADALRAAGYPSEAARYDFLSLIASGASDSRGNDCAPIDALGKYVHDGRLPRPFSLRWIDGCLLGNDRGLYYLASSSIAAFTPGEILSRLAKPAAEEEQDEEVTPTFARPTFEILGLDSRRAIAREQCRAGLLKIFNRDDLPMLDGARVSGPFMRLEQGWIGYIAELPEVHHDSELFCIIDADRLGPFEIMPGNWVQFGQAELDKDAVRKLDVRLFAAKRWRLAPPFHHVDKLQWQAMIPDLADISDGIGWDHRSPLLAFEAGRRMPGAHAPHVDISDLGAGRYSHWEHTFYFSTLDGSDPNSSGRSYELMLSLDNPKASQLDEQQLLQEISSR